MLPPTAPPTIRLSQTLNCVVLWVLSLLLFRDPLRALVALSLRDERYTHTVVMPLLSLGLIYLYRRRIFLDTQYWPRIGIPLTAAAMALLYLSRWWSSSLGPTGALSLAVSSIVLVWISAFVWLFGLSASRAAVYPLFFLLLIIPIPPAWFDIAEIALQKATAEVTGVLFQLTSLPVFREGMRFSLPGVTVEVARACSGIRSSIALLIAALVLSHLLLRSPWRKATVIVLTIPIAIFKNAFRIATLSWLSVYVSKDFLFGDLHHRGGPLFFLLSFALLLAVLLVLQRSETGSTGRLMRISTSDRIDPQGKE